MSGSNSERTIKAVDVVEVVVVVLESAGSPVATTTGSEMADWRRVRPRLDGEEEEDDDEDINNIVDDMEAAGVDGTAATWLGLCLFVAEEAATVDRKSRDCTT